MTRAYQGAGLHRALGAFLYFAACLFMQISRTPGVFAVFDVYSLWAFLAH